MKVENNDMIGELDYESMNNCSAMGKNSAESFSLAMNDLIRQIDIKFKCRQIILKLKKRSIDRY